MRVRRKIKERWRYTDKIATLQQQQQNRRTSLGGSQNMTAAEKIVTPQAHCALEGGRGNIHVADSL